MKIAFSSILLALSALLAIPLQAQEAANLYGVHTGYFNNWGEIAQRFGYNFGIGAEYHFKTKSNWTFGADLTYYFGMEVPAGASITADLRGRNGNLFSQSGNYSEVNTFMRGISSHFLVGSRLPLLQLNPNSGTHFSLGAGYMSHWIAFDNIGNDAPQIIEDYAKGYDRLSGGFSTKQSLSFLYLSSNERINFRLSLEFMQAFTTNYRGFNYDTGQYDNDLHFDYFYSLKLHWYVPVYLRAKSEYYID